MVARHTSYSPLHLTYPCFFFMNNGLSCRPYNETDPTLSPQAVSRAPIPLVLVSHATGSWTTRPYACWSLLMPWLAHDLSSDLSAQPSHPHCMPRNLQTHASLTPVQVARSPHLAQLHVETCRCQQITPSTCQRDPAFPCILPVTTNTPSCCTNLL